MTSLRRLLLTSSVLSLPLVAGCGIFGNQVSLEMTDADKQRCPAAGIVAYTGEITHFVDGKGRTTADVIDRGSMSGLRVNCFNTATGVDASVSFDVSASTGAAGHGSSVDLTYFVTINGDDDKTLEKKLYRVNVPTRGGSGSERQIVGVQIPFDADGVELVDQEVLIGFQLTKEQLTYNINR
jgi:hypothetical protein